MSDLRLFRFPRFLRFRSFKAGILDAAKHEASKANGLLDNAEHGLHGLLAQAVKFNNELPHDKEIRSSLMRGFQTTLGTKIRL